MKISIFNRILAFALILFMGVSCDENIEELNIDPNEPTDVPPSSLVTRAMFQMVDRYWGRADNFEFAMLMVQHFAQAEYTEEQRYNFNPTNFNGTWAAYYTGGLVDLQVAKDLILADEALPAAEKANQLAVIDIMMAFGFQVLTDTYGDIPYTQALNADETTQPAYDDQSAIYADLIDNVSSAVSSISTSADGFSSDADIIYNGNMDGWQKFGNALLLRMGMRVADANNSLASSTVASALGGNIISSVDDQASLVYRTEEALANPFWFDAAAVGGNRDDFRITEELLGTLQDMDDPREEMYADTTNTGEFIGMPYGLGDNDAFSLKPTTSRFAASIRQPTSPAYILRYSEVKFLEAEAIERGFVSGDAEIAFNDGVEAAMNEWGITDATAINDYLTANPYDAGNWEESIGLQLWIALYTNGNEAWATWRRLDEPALEVPAAALESSIPVRGLYPQIEQSTNEQSMLAASQSDELDAKVWWDAN